MDVLQAAQVFSLWKFGELSQILADSLQIPLKDFVKDFVFMAMMMGNDYLPHVARFEIVCDLPCFFECFFWISVGIHFR